MFRTIALLSLVGLMGCDLTVRRETWAFPPRYVQHFAEYRNDIRCEPAPNEVPFPDLTTLEYDEAVVGTECFNGIRRDIHLYLEFDVSPIYRRGEPGTLVRANVYFQSDPDSGCSPDTAAIFDVNFGAERIVRRDRFRVLTAPTTMVDDEVWSFRRRQTFLGQGDSLPVRPSVSGRYVYPTNERGAEKVRADLSDDIVSVVILASDAEDTALCLEHLSPVGLSLVFAVREAP